MESLNETQRTYIKSLGRTVEVESAFLYDRKGKVLIEVDTSNVDAALSGVMKGKVGKVVIQTVKVPWVSLKRAFLENEDMMEQ